MRFVIVTGMSGSGKSTALKMLEDAGYYCVDNLPVSLIEKFMELLALPNNEIEKVVLGLDVRAEAFEDVAHILEALRIKGYQFEILFMNATDETLIKRYKESRRLHPVDPDGRIEDGVAKERILLEEIRKQADYVIDTSGLLTRELKAELDRIFVDGEEYNNLMVNIMSFGYKRGIPREGDLVFDVRFLPNPYYVPELKRRTGLEAPVRDYVFQSEQTHEFLRKLEEMLLFLLPHYNEEGKTMLVLGIGCTGGHHRSVAIAHEISTRLQAAGFDVSESHRDISR